MPYRVFSQSATLDLAGLVRNATRHFSSHVEVLSSTPLRVSVGSARFRLEFLPTTEEVLERARAAEVRGQAAGMASLAERCTTVCVIHPEDHDDELATQLLIGALASTVLGPVLPPDDSTLYGVRGAMARIAAAQKA